MHSVPVFDYRGKKPSTVVTLTPTNSTTSGSSNPLSLTRIESEFYEFETNIKQSEVKFSGKSKKKSRESGKREMQFIFVAVRRRPGRWGMCRFHSVACLPT